MTSQSSSRSPYMQLEFTAADDITKTSDAEDGPERPNANHRAGSISRQTQTARTRSGPRVLAVSTGAFFLALILLMFITSFACRSFVYGILRILEEEIDLSGGETLAIVLSYDIGFVVVVVIMALQNRKMHRPKSIGFGGFLIGVGLLVVCIPYFIVRSELADGQWYLSKYELCDGSPRPTIDNKAQVHQDPPKANWNSVAWIVLGLVIAGIGAVPQFPLGITYLEDRLHGFGTPFYVAILLCAYLLGIWCGELANLFMWQHVAIANSTTVALWWLGFFCSAMLALVIGLFMFMAKDPHKGLVKETRGALPTAGGRAANGSQYRRLDPDDENRPQAAPKVEPRWRRILTNVQLLCLGLGGSCEVALLTGFLVFLPRYVGTISNMGRGPAKFYIGTTVISSICIGILTSSGLTLYKRMKSKGLCRMVIIGCAVALFFMWPLYLFRCSSPEAAGDETADGLFLPSDGKMADFLGNLNTTSPCNDGCRCSKLPFRPVCGSDGLMYLSPCFAGCRGEQTSDEIDSQGLKLTNFTDCSCVMTSSNSTKIYDLGYALSGPCASDCSNEWPFFAIIFVAFFMTGLQFGPMVLVSTRCVIRADRIASLSFQVSLWHIVGYVPAVVYFSVILNQSCVLWGRPDARNYHECDLYDSSIHNVYFVTTAVILKALSLVFLAVAYKFMRKGGSRVNMEWAEYDTIEMEQVERLTNPRPRHL